jgi:hypothetical protein
MIRPPRWRFKSTSKADPVRRVQERHVASARARLGEAAWEAALQAGKALSLQEAVELALTAGGS